jgi:hypothetical protein
MSDEEHHDGDECEVFDVGDVVWRRDDGGGGRTEIAVQDLEPGDAYLQGSLDWDDEWLRVADVHVTGDGRVHVLTDAED